MVLAATHRAADLNPLVIVLNLKYIEHLYFGGFDVVTSEQLADAFGIAVAVLAVG
jgi:hypothetical protein